MCVVHVFYVVDVVVCSSFSASSFQMSSVAPLCCSVLRVLWVGGGVGAERGVLVSEGPCVPSEGIWCFWGLFGTLGLVSRREVERVLVLVWGLRRFGGVFGENVDFPGFLGFGGLVL